MRPYWKHVCRGSNRPQRACCRLSSRWRRVLGRCHQSQGCKDLLNGFAQPMAISLLSDLRMSCFLQISLYFPPIRGQSSLQIIGWEFQLLYNGLMTESKSSRESSRNTYLPHGQVCCMVTHHARWRCPTACSHNSVSSDLKLSPSTSCCCMMPINGNIADVATSQAVVPSKHRSRNSLVNFFALHLQSKHLQPASVAPQALPACVSTIPSKH